MRVLYLKVGGAMDGAQHIILMMEMEDKLSPIKINTWASRTVSGCLDTRVGGYQVHLAQSSKVNTSLPLGRLPNEPLYLNWEHTLSMYG